MTSDTVSTAPAGELAARVERLRLELHDAAAAFIARIHEAEPAADRLAHVEAELRAAENIAGIHDGRPPARELAAEVVCGCLRGLQPYLKSAATREAAMRASEELLSR